MNLDSLLKHEDPLVKKLAERADELTKLRAEGKLDKEEYDKLARQLVLLRDIDGIAFDAERQRAMQEALQIVRAVLGVVL